jgi:hypothetical protein
LWRALEDARRRGESGLNYTIVGRADDIGPTLIARGDSYYRALAAGFYWSFAVVDHSPGVSIAMAALNRDPVKLWVYKPPQPPTQNDNAPGQNDDNADGN